MSLLSTRFVLVGVCTAFFILSLTSCDTIAPPLEELPPEENNPPSEIEPPVVKTDTTYDKANLRYSKFEGYSYGFVDGRWSFLSKGVSYNQPGYTSVFEWTGQQWKSVQDLPFKDTYVSFEGNPDVTALLGSRDISIYENRAILHAYARYHSASHVDYWKGNAIIFAWNGSEWVEEANLFADDPLGLNTDVYFVSMGKDIALVGIAGADVAEGAQTLAFRWTGTTWQRTIVDGASGPGEVIGEELYIKDNLSSFSIFAWDGQAWARVQTVATPRTSSWDVDQHYAFFEDPGNDQLHSFERNGSSWTEGPILAQKSDSLGFGLSIATDGDFLAVSTGSHASYICSLIYLYERVKEEWVVVDTLQAPIRENGCSSFGRYLSLNKRRLLVADGTVVHSYSW